ncbi:MULTISPECIES: hypothetical protein [Stenotrophomonas]|uniref:Transmembrane protein n=2 Tax=Stenotrophomonas maltophilia TaxID=40324 RepID=A0A2J0SMU9_STEMA|nr:MULTISPECIES: hypothetical protein [Stenotrophomonas]MBA0310437.1 hypothetical protein [Stenotrophomonas maltophilia]MBH1408433.1 hypothetical protein [Stenotrophomonas maltophilia]MBH1745903.1 hypothetical protein [Stenotrophomonas maltophilia]MBH1864677.1 hypothetical protein [Stenotrophomonas maltophilia]MDH1387542.1 hypothetical protein [Stenotrophomonas sp. GD03701]
MNVWNPMTVRTFAPAMVGWCLTLAAWLRLEEVREDRLAQAMLPVLQGSVLALLALTLACTMVASLVLWRHSRRDHGCVDAGTTEAQHPSAGTGMARAGRH